jgi:hypothetical protein
MTRGVLQEGLPRAAEAPACAHRGQLAAYLRAMGSKVPNIYGPSADEKGDLLVSAATSTNAS